MRAFLFLLILFFLASCVGGGEWQNRKAISLDETVSTVEKEPISTAEKEQEKQEVQREALRQQLLAGLQNGSQGGSRLAHNARGYQTVTLLAPFSGSEASLGDSLLKSASMALFEHPDVRISLLSLDTASGVKRAVEMAQSEQSKVIIGPVRASEVKQVESSLRNYGASVFSLSNSQSIAEGNNGVIYPMGFVPQDQVRVILETLIQRGKRRITVIAPDNQYGKLVQDQTQQYASKNNKISFHRIPLYPPSEENFSAFIKKIKGVDAILIAPLKPQNLRIIAAQLDSVNKASPKVQIVGLQLWDNFADLKNEPSLRSAIWVSAKNDQTLTFRKKYKEIFKQEPHNLAPIAYDIMKMIIAKSKSGNLLFQPNQSFNGINGNFTLLENGRIKRNYYLRQIKDSQYKLLN